MIDTYVRFPILLKAINFINLTNLGNANPYHGIDHLFTVFKFASKNAQRAENPKELLLAAIFHDYGHRGKMGNDAINIAAACEGVMLFHKANPEFDAGYVYYLIKCTEYPYVVDEEELTEDAKILRDADMSYLFQDLSLVKLYYGLRTEMGISLEKFMAMQETFFNQLKFYDYYTQKQWEQVRQLRIKELRLLSDNV